jgi:outer membrane lipoprotein carrier protein
MAARVTLAAMVVAASVAVAAAASAATHAGASSAQLKAILDKIQHHYDATKSSSAHFHEEIAPVGGVKRIREGTVYFRKPGRMRWEFTTPQPETIVSDGEQLYSYEPDLNQVVESPLKQALKTNGAVGFLLGIGNIRRDFDTALPAGKPADGRVHVLLKPKADSLKFELILDPASYDIVGFTMTDQIGDVTKLSFSDIRDNPSLDDALFAFKAPEGADIVTAPAPVK